MSKPIYRQVTGGSSRIVMYRETSPGVVDSSDAGVILAIYDDSTAVSSNKQASSVITGKRGAGKPMAGTPDYSGGMNLAPYVAQTGHVLRAICGKPETSKVEAFALAEAEVTDEGNGLVGLPAVDNPFPQDCAVTILGTTNYDGTYRLEAGTGKDKLVISHVYTSETLTGTAMAHRGRGAFLKGDVVDMSSGKVGLPVDGAGVALSVGDTITVDGTTNYDGEHTLAEGTTSSLLVFEASYTAESLDGTPTAIPVFYKHEFKLPRVQPTVALQKHFDFEEGAAVEPYSLFSSCKVNSYSFSFGGEQEIQFAVEWSMGSHENRADSLNSSLTPADLPQSGWADKETAIWMDGKRLGDVQNGSITQSFNIEAVAAVGDMGKRYRQNEGDPSCDVAFTAFLEEDKYQQLVDASAKVSMDISMDNAVGDELWLHVYEAELDSSGAQITGKAGLTQDFTAMGYVDQGETLCGYTLINRVASYN